MNTEFVLGSLVWLDLIEIALPIMAHNEGIIKSETLECIVANRKALKSPQIYANALLPSSSRAYHNYYRVSRLIWIKIDRLATVISDILYKQDSQYF